MVTAPSLFRPLVELVNGQACRPHPADAGLPLGRRFANATLIVIGGGGTGLGWTQRISFDRHGSPAFAGGRSSHIKRGSEEWTNHLQAERGGTCGWSVLLIEQQWQAAVSSASAASLSGPLVERMLRVRDAAAMFGDDRLSDDAVRIAIDHPTMEGAIVGGVRATLVDLLEQEAMANGFEVAAVRLAVFSVLERHLALLSERHSSPDSGMVVHDGQSALIVGIRDGAFDSGEGGLSYVVNRAPAELRAQVARRISLAAGLAEPRGKFVVLGMALPADLGGADALNAHEKCDVLLASVSPEVRHDLRSDLREMRVALPRWVRGAVVGGGLVVAAAVAGAVVQGVEGVRLQQGAVSIQRGQVRHERAAARARTQIALIVAAEQHARHIADWVDRNYHAQQFVYSFLTALPREVSLDAVAFQAAEGLPQGRLKFTLIGTEEAQRQALRAVESRLYELGYEIGRRDDPVPASALPSAVVYGWDLILPNFGDSRE